MEGLQNVISVQIFSHNSTYQRHFSTFEWDKNDELITCVSASQSLIQFHFGLIWDGFALAIENEGIHKAESQSKWLNKKENRENKENRKLFKQLI